MHYGLMEHFDQQPKPFRAPERTAFDVWLGRTLKAHHENAMHEPIPDALLDLLPPPTKER